MDLSLLIGWHRLRHPESAHIDNTPQSEQSLSALADLHEQLLVPIATQFGTPQITYGFTSALLLKYILKHSPGHMAPELDQHAAFELNSRGNRICKRDGAACDVWLPNSQSSMQHIAAFVAESLPFDSLYFYGKGRPIHISFGPEHKRQLIVMRSINGRRMPRVSSLDDLKEQMDADPGAIR